MSIAKEDIEGFFVGYAKALSARDVSAIVRCWGAPGLVLSDEGAIAVASLEEVDAFFSAAIQQYDKITSAHPRIESTMTLSEKVISCDVTWDHRDGSGRLVGGEAGHYILRRETSGLRIHVYSPRTVSMHP